MPGLRPRWMAALLLGAGLMAAGQGRAEEAPTPPLKDPASQTATVEETQSVPGGATSTPAAPQPAAKPPPTRKSQPLKRFRPSEEIHVDKEVDFPADI